MAVLSQKKVSSMDVPINTSVCWSYQKVYWPSLNIDQHYLRILDPSDTGIHKCWILQNDIMSTKKWVSALFDDCNNIEQFYFEGVLSPRTHGWNETDVKAKVTILSQNVLARIEKIGEDSFKLSPGALYNWDIFIKRDYSKHKWLIRLVKNK